ncbi:MAG: hypothetical protein ACRDRN_00020 [Sciscionella sp.]
MAHEDEAQRTQHIEASEQTRRQPRRDPAKVRAQVIGLIADIIRWVGLLFAVVLVVFIILTIGGANPSNGITTFVGNWADTISLGFKDLFTPDDAKLRVLVNYGIAAIFWLVVTMIIAKLLRRAA